MIDVFQFSKGMYFPQIKSVSINYSQKLVSLNSLYALKINMIFLQIHKSEYYFWNNYNFSHEKGKQHPVLFINNGYGFYT
jgi:hypothetical protein